jgi:hypothetical protein
MVVRQRKRNRLSPKVRPASFRPTVSPAGTVRFDEEVERMIPDVARPREVHVTHVLAAVWAGLQLDYDMARAMEHADRIKLRRVSQPATGAD